MKQLVWNVTWRKGAFMHGKRIHKIEVAFQFFLREMFFKEIKALQNISLFDVWGTHAIPRPFWLIGLCVASISFTELNLCLKAILLQVYPKSLETGKYMLSATFFPFF
jgi:hypothetical protein